MSRAATARLVNIQDQLPCILRHAESVGGYLYIYIYIYICSRSQLPWPLSSIAPPAWGWGGGARGAGIWGCPAPSCLRMTQMQCNAMQCKAMQGNATQCNAMQCNAMECSAMQCNAIPYNSMQCNAMQSITRQDHMATGPQGHRTTGPQDHRGGRGARPHPRTSTPPGGRGGGRRRAGTYIGGIPGSGPSLAGSFPRHGSWKQSCHFVTSWFPVPHRVLREVSRGRFWELFEKCFGMLVGESDRVRMSRVQKFFSA